MLKRRHFLGVSLLAALIASVPALLAREAKVVLDDRDWLLSQVNELDSTLEVLTDGDTHPPIYQVTVLRPGEVYLQRRIPSDIVAANKPLLLRFRARAQSPRQIHAAVFGDTATAWTQAVDLTADWKEFRLPISAPLKAANTTYLALEVGSTAGEVAITDLKVENGS